MFTRSAHFPKWVFDKGDAPDPRFSLANERTLLAWLRTSLALIGAGVALGFFDLDIHYGIKSVSSILLLVVGSLTSLGAWFSWARAERAMRQKIPLPNTIMGPFVTLTVACAGVLIMVALFLD